MASEVVFYAFPAPSRALPNLLMSQSLSAVQQEKQWKTIIMPDQRSQLAKQIARGAGETANAFLTDLMEKKFEIEVKGPQDFVTKADKEVETYIRQYIHQAFPDDGLLGEEYGIEAGTSGFTWVIDPIDGTANYIRGIDYWAISIAVVSENRIEVGVIYDPVRDKLYFAEHGGGTYLNDTLLDPAKSIRPADPLVILGRSKRHPFESYLRTQQYLYDKGIEYRRFASAALGLAHVAEGLADGYLETDLNPWDCLAGLLLVSEMGGTIVAGTNMHKALTNLPICAVHPYLADDFTELLER